MLQLHFPSHTDNFSYVSTNSAVTDGVFFFGNDYKIVEESAGLISYSAISVLILSPIISPKLSLVLNT